MAVRTRSTAAPAALVLLLSACSVLAPEEVDAPASPTPAAVSPAASAPPAPTWEGVAAETSSGVARVAVLACDEQSSGSGFLVGPDRLVTAAHVIEGAESIALRFGAATYAAEVLAIDRAIDLALLHVGGAPDGHVFTVRSEAPAVGGEVAALGYP